MIQIERKRQACVLTAERIKPALEMESALNADYPIGPRHYRESSSELGLIEKLAHRQ